MKRRTLVSLVVLSLVFLALFAARFAYELSRGAARPYQQQDFKYAAQVQSFSPEGPALSKRNYASAKIAVAQPSATAQILDQKYEQVARLSSTTREFEADSKRLKEAAAAAKAVVQSEDAYGLPGSRSLSMSLGVVPDFFEPAIESLRAVGKIESITVAKADKTADYKALEARRLSLEKTRDGLAALRRAGADLADLISLETKILEIEGQIQELGVSLGDFSEGNSFCTINATLREIDGSFDWSRVPGAALDALAWAAGTSALAAIACLAAAGTAALGALAWRKYRELAARKAA
ncbi:MAG: DUF4349 domain-containing protein [Spirochaetaceae bacterium]|nr:DUF4349 domain-containing protein [Spirochaetaceae bacterium]